MHLKEIGSKAHLAPPPAEKASAPSNNGNSGGGPQIETVTKEDSAPSIGPRSDIWNNDDLKGDLPAKEATQTGDSVSGGNSNEPGVETPEGQAAAEAKELKEKIIELLGDGDEVVPLNAFLKAPVKIRGEEKLVSIQDLINNYSGETDFGTKYAKLNQEKQIYENQRRQFLKNQEQWDKFSQSIAERIKSGEPTQVMDAWEDLISKTGIDPAKFTHHLVKGLLPTIQKYSQMTPEEQALYDRQVEFDASMRRQERERQAFTAEKEAYEKERAISKISAEVDEKGKSYGFNLEQFDNGFKKLQDLREKGLFKGDIEPDNVFAVLFQDRVEEESARLLKEKAPELAKDKEKAERFVRQMQKQVLTDYWSGELKDAKTYELEAAELLAKETAKAVSRKVAPAGPQGQAAQKGNGRANGAAKSPLNPRKFGSKEDGEDLSFLQGRGVVW